jgi:predicted NUDIX family NTP pyrophosphohydrolase
MSMAVVSAGILLFHRDGPVEVLLVHPGGPFWARRDEHAWSIPKGEFDPETEEPFACAVREFGEETGFELPSTQPLPLGSVPQSSGKTVYAWALEGWVDPAGLESNEFEMEWPPRSGERRSYPEVDRAAWFDLATARSKIHKGQVHLLDRLGEVLGD